MCPFPPGELRMENVSFCVLPALLCQCCQLLWAKTAGSPLSPLCAAVPCAVVAVWPRRAVDTAFRLYEMGPMVHQTIQNSAALGEVKASYRSRTQQMFPLLLVFVVTGAAVSVLKINEVEVTLPADHIGG